MGEQTGKEPETVEAAIARPSNGPPPDPAPAFSLEELFAEHHATVYHAAYRITGHSSDAEDVLQTVFLRLARRDEPVELGAGAASYLARAAVNAGLDIVRARKRSAVLTLDEPTSPVPRDTAAGPERRHWSRQLQGRLRQALGTVSPRAAEIFALRYFEGLGNKEIAQLLDTSQTAIAVTLHRTRARLREELGSELGGLS